MRGEAVRVLGIVRRKGPGALRSFCEWRGKSPSVPYCSPDMISRNIKLWLFWSFVIFLPVCRISSSPREGSDERRGPETWRGMISSRGAGRPGIIGNEQRCGHSSTGSPEALSFRLCLLLPSFGSDGRRPSLHSLFFTKKSSSFLGVFL